MASDAPVKDIFDGAEKIEILGKLPFFLWAYIDKGRALASELVVNPEQCASYVEEASRLLEVLHSAATHLNNEKLHEIISLHGSMVCSFRDGDCHAHELVELLTTGLSDLEGMAGPRQDPSLAIGPDGRSIEKELEKHERVKTGRSADMVVNHELIRDLQDFLTGEVVTEGVSSVLLIDDAGTLIARVGDRTSVDGEALAAVAAANFAATEKIANLIGERDFVLLFYKGHNESFHFCRIGKQYILVTIFNNSLSLGLLRLRIAAAAEALDSKLPKREG
jgi:predicted regulator of Ras-like GTPase activity (Roadblock/LC7/MglB family)